MPSTPTTSCTMGIVRVWGAPETKCLWCDWGHLHRENPCSALTFLTLLHSCRITGRRTKTEMWTEKRARTQRTNSKSRGKHAKWCFAKSWQRHFSLLLTRLGGIQPSAVVFTRQTLRLTLSILVTVRRTERDFLPKAAQTKTLPDPQRDALNMPTNNRLMGAETTEKTSGAEKDT